MKVLMSNNFNMLFIFYLNTRKAMTVNDEFQSINDKKSDIRKEQPQK